MKPHTTIAYEFVEFIPANLTEGIVYVSLTYATVVHKCCCGCGSKVVTPLTPTDWKLIFDGKTISLYPSIGNWSFNCKSHYWIKDSKVVWAEQWSQKKIDAGRAYDRLAKEKYFKPSDDNEISEHEEKGFWRLLKKWWPSETDRVISANTKSSTFRLPSVPLTRTKPFKKP